MTAMDNAENADQLGSPDDLAKESEKYLPEYRGRFLVHPKTGEMLKWRLLNGELPRDDNHVPSRVICICPACDGVIVANMYFNNQRGFMLRFECWESILLEPTCYYAESMV